MKNFSIFEEKLKRAKPTKFLIADAHNFAGKRLFLFESWLHSNVLNSSPALPNRRKSGVEWLYSSPALPSRGEGRGEWLYRSRRDGGREVGRKGLYSCRRKVGVEWLYGSPALPSRVECTG